MKKLLYCKGKTNKECKMTSTRIVLAYKKKASKVAVMRLWEPL